MPLEAWVSTYERSLVGHGGQNVIQDEQQDGDGQQHGDFEAQLLSSMVCDEEGGEVQNQEEQDGQQEVGDMEEGPPLHGELRKIGSKVRQGRPNDNIMTSSGVQGVRSTFKKDSPLLVYTVVEYE